MTAFETEGKLVVISGGSQGLGASLAKELVQLGADVVVVSRTESKLQNVVATLKELRVNDSQTVGYVVADVSNAQESTRVFTEIARVPDIVIMCAGSAFPGLFLDMDAGDLEREKTSIYDTSLYFSHAALKVMARENHDYSKKRHLVFCSSVLALFPFIGYSSYAPSKAAIRALADVLRQECIPYNISVTNVMPGNMDTEGYEREMKTKPEITKIIEGPSEPKNPDDVARQVISDLKRGRQMIYTDFIGWVLSGLMLGASPRTLGFFQTLIGILLTIFSPVWMWLVSRDIKKYFTKHAEEKPLEEQQ
jgi:3-dehydrosphinganine reductase